MDAPPSIQASVDELLSSWVTWSRFRGAPYATIVLKATLQLLHGRAAEVLSPEPISKRDRLRPSGALERADDTAPFMAGAAVLVHGSVDAGDATPHTPTLARVVVGVEQPVVDKTIAAVKRGRIPLVWEEALLTHDNPVGSDEPRLVDPRGLDRAAGFGPIAPTWPARVRFLPSPLGVYSDFMELPERIDPRFFNPAPTDQQCAVLTGREAILLTRLVPGAPELQTWLPALSIAGQVALDGARAQAPFTLDTLTIDAETARATLLFRYTMPLAPTAKKLAYSAALGGGFDRTRRASAAQAAPPAAPRPEPPPAEVAPPPPPPPEPAAPPVRRALERVSDPRGAVLARIAAGAPLEDLDLTGADLHDIDLAGRSLARSKLDRANLKGAKLTGARLTEASLVEANLDGAKLEGADLERANLERARGAGASLTKANLAHARLVQAALNGAVVDDADLSDADATQAALNEAKLRRVKANRIKLDRTSLVGADFEYAALDFASLTKASLDDASFVGASLADASLEKSIASGARLTKARLVRANLSGVRLTSAIMSGADLASANLERADLTSARLDGATLDEANAQGAKLVNADLTGASLERTDLRGADLSSARLKNTDRSTANLEGAKLKNVIE